MFTYKHADGAEDAVLLDGGRAVARGFGVAVRLDGEAPLALACGTAAQRGGSDALGDYTEYALSYTDEAEPSGIVVRLKLRCYDAHMLGFVEGRIARDNDFANHRAFAPDDGVVVRLGRLDAVTGLMANYRHKDWWTRPHFDPNPARLPARTQSLLWRTDDSYYQLLPVCGPVWRADLQGEGGSGAGLTIRLSSGQVGLTACDAFAFILGGDERDPYALAERNADAALRQLGDPALPRTRKPYPDMLDYLGWCSWDAFYHEVDEAGLAAKAEELQRLGLPVRWAMIDDGWSQTEDRKLQAFDADPDKFPRGLAHAVRSLKERFGIRWVGVWHTIAGYWNGIHPDSELASACGDYLYRTSRGNIVPYPDPARGFGFWHAWHGYLKRQGVDFVKVDSQSAVQHFLRGQRSIGAASAAAHQALEASVALHFGGAIINCMGMGSENIWHRPVSAVSRSSDDFVPQERGGFREHALQNGYNSYYHGPFYWGDWDMFWTDHHDDVQHAVLRAVSGGPVYFSDAVGRTKAERLRPLVYRDGRIVRCDRTANPTPDCLLRDPSDGAIPLKLWNTAGGAGVVAAFHVGEGPAPVAGSVSAADAPGMDGGKGRVLLYEFFERSCRMLAARETQPFELQPGACRLFLLIPSDGAVTPIGLTDKYVATDALAGVWREGDSTFVRLREGGLFAFAADSEPRRVSVDGQPVACDKRGGVYEVDCRMAAQQITVEIAL